MAVGVGNIRGISYSGVERFIKDNFGDEALQKVMTSLPQDAQRVFAGKFNPMAWYSLDLFIAFLAAADQVCAKGDGMLGYQTGRAAAENAFSGLYRLFLEHNEPRTIIVRAPMAWDIIHDAGSLQIEEAHDKKVYVNIFDFPIPHKSYCWHLAGYFERVLELSGARSAQVREVSCSCEGGQTCKFEATWG